MSAKPDKIFIRAYAENKDVPPSYFRMYREGDNIESIVLCDKNGVNIKDYISLDSYHTDTFYISVGSFVTYYKDGWECTGEVIACTTHTYYVNGFTYYMLDVKDKDTGQVLTLAESRIKLENRVPEPSLHLNKDIAEWFGV